MRVIGHFAGAVPGTNAVECQAHRARMVPVTVRQHDALDLTEVGAEPRGIALEGIIFRSAVEQHSVPRIAARHRDHTRQSVYRAAEAAARCRPQAPARRADEFAFDITGRRRQTIG